VAKYLYSLQYLHILFSGGYDEAQDSIDSLPSQRLPPLLTHTQPTSRSSVATSTSKAKDKPTIPKAQTQKTKNTKRRKTVEDEDILVLDSDDDKTLSGRTHRSASAYVEVDEGSSTPQPKQPTKSSTNKMKDTRKKKVEEDMDSEDEVFSEFRFLSAYRYSPFDCVSEGFGTSRNRRR
jgi:hypothetical protein